MARNNQLVDVSEAKTFIEANWPNDPLLRQIALNLLDRLPRVDLVHCRECKKEWCYLRQELGADGYCSAGERKDNG